MASQLPRDRARAIVSECFNGFVNNPPLPTGPEADQIKIKSVLEGLDKNFRASIHQCITDKIEDPARGCTTGLGATGFVNATYETVGDIVDDMQLTTNCP